MLELADREKMAEKVITDRFPGIRRKYYRALSYGIVSDADLLSDYQLGVAMALPRAEKWQGDTSCEDFLHYRGLCEVQRQLLLRRQKTTLNICDQGHTYAFNKGRKNCPQCGSVFIQDKKFRVIADDLHLFAPQQDKIDLEDIRKVVNLLPLPPKQKRIFKVLIGQGLFLEEEHAISKTAKVVGISRIRVAKVVRDNRDAVRDALVTHGFLS